MLSNIVDDDSSSIIAKNQRSNRFLLQKQKLFYRKYSMYSYGVFKAMQSILPSRSTSNHHTLEILLRFLGNLHRNRCVIILSCTFCLQCCLISYHYYVSQTHRALFFDQNYLFAWLMLKKNVFLSCVYSFFFLSFFFSAILSRCRVHFDVLSVSI